MFTGEFTHSLIQNFADYIENYLEPYEELPVRIKKRTYHIVIEMLQNVYRHGQRGSNPADGPIGLFHFRITGTQLVITTANATSIATARKVKERIEALNALSQDNVRSAYTIQLTEGSLSEKGGAGLGLIDIARKCKNPLGVEIYETITDQTILLISVRMHLT